MLDSVILDGTKFDNAILGSAMFDSAMQCCTTLNLNAQICGFHICKLQPCDLKQCFMLECSAYNWVLFWQMQYKGKIVTFQHFNVIPKVILIKLQTDWTRAEGAVCQIKLNQIKLNYKQIGQEGGRYAKLN